MTKLEFLDKINDILVGLNTLESDLLGSLYDELMRNTGWHPTSELPPVGENGNSTDVIAIDEDNEPIKVSYSKFYKCWVLDGATAESFDKITIKRWCYPPKED